MKIDPRTPHSRLGLIESAKGLVHGYLTHFQGDDLYLWTWCGKAISRNTAITTAYDAAGVGCKHCRKAREVPT